tara:strand:- start:1542 stop:1832 length:291 start_codon:yes stop_codon:yes gene_type:complete
MSRRRSTDKHQPLTISVPASMMARLDQLLSYQQSRSKWVQAAIKAKLDGYTHKTQIIDDMSDKDLLQLLTNRGVIDYELFLAIKSKMPELNNSTSA